MDFSWDPATPSAGELITFTGAAEGSQPITYDWEFGDGAFGAGNPASHTYVDAGDYAVVLTATNACGPGVEVEQVVLVAELAPAIEVSPLAFDVTLVSGDMTTETLVISNTGDAPLSYVITDTNLVGWLTFDPADGNVLPGDAELVDVVFDATGLAAGVYTTTLEVESNDPLQPVVSVDVMLTVEAACVPASLLGFTWQPAVPLVSEPVTFTAEAEGSAPVTYEWDFGDGLFGAGNPATHTYPDAGDYNVVVTATNACGVDDLAQVVTVYEPLPVMVVSPLAITATLAVGELSTETLEVANDGGALLSFAITDTLAVSWLGLDPLEGDVDPASQMPVTLAFDATGLAVGTYTTTLEVTGNDADNPSVLVEVTLVVVEPCLEVSADFTWLPAAPGAGQTVTFNATADGSEPIDFAWDFGDGVTETGDSVTHVFAAGTYTVTLTATNACSVDIVTYEITVTAEPPVWEMFLPLVVKQ